MANNQERVLGLSPDRPESLPNKDLLGFNPFSQQIATAILKGAPDDGLVIAIYAPWGAGKSTALNFIEWHLGNGPERPPVVVRFNPWWFPGDELLVRSFFGQLQATLASKAARLADELKGPIAQLAMSVSNAPLGELSPWTKLGQKGLKALASYLQQQPEVTKLKEQIAEVLRKQSQTIVVIIDDVDRLTPSEIRQLFRMLKAVADFPKVVYLLAFEKSIVSKALLEDQSDGAAYLEKIVQVPFELPYADRTAIYRLLFSRLDQILGEPATDFDQAHWANTFSDGIGPLIRTPRDAVRLTNALSVTYPAVAGDVNPVDFIAIEAVRVYVPQVYAVIRSNQQRFAPTGFDRMDEKGIKAFHEQWPREVDERLRPVIVDLVKNLFPNIAWTLGGTRYGDGWSEGWRKNRRVCSPDNFPTYFRFAVPEGKLTRTQIEEVLQSTGDREKFQELLLSFAAKKNADGSSAIRGLLDRLQDYTGKDIPEVHIPVILGVFAEIGDDLAQADETSGMFEFGAETYVGRLTWQLLRRVSAKERCALLRTAFENGHALAENVGNVVVLGQQQGSEDQPRDPAEWFVTKEELDELQSLMAKRIDSCGQAGDLADQYRLPLILHWWSEWGSDKAPGEWIAQQMDSDEQLAKVLQSYVAESRSQSGDSRLVQRNRYFNFESLAKHCDLERLRSRVKEIDASSISEPYREGVKLFLASPEMKNPSRWGDD